eukprot:1161201-Pelagomonas_calceolata.AAC.5
MLCQNHKPKKSCQTLSCWRKGVSLNRDIRGTALLTTLLVTELLRERYYGKVFELTKATSGYDVTWAGDEAENGDYVSCEANTRPSPRPQDLTKLDAHSQLGDFKLRFVELGTSDIPFAFQATSPGTDGETCNQVAARLTELFKACEESPVQKSAGGVN